MEQNRVGIRAMQTGSIHASNYRIAADLVEVRVFWFIVAGVAGGLIMLACAGFLVRKCRLHNPVPSYSPENNGTSTINPLPADTQFVGSASELPSVAYSYGADKRHHA
jgi:hypothetical protein